MLATCDKKVRQHRRSQNMQRNVCWKMGTTQQIDIKSAVNYLKGGCAGSKPEFLPGGRQKEESEFNMNQVSTIDCRVKCCHCDDRRRLQTTEYCRRQPVIDSTKLALVSDRSSSFSSKQLSKNCFMDAKLVLFRFNESIEVVSGISLQQYHLDPSE